MKRKPSGKVVYAKGDGIRRRYRELLEEKHFLHPRRYVSKTVTNKWLMSDEPLKRPLFGLYRLAKYAEGRLYLSRKTNPFHGGTPRPDEDLAFIFFSDTRRAMRNVLYTTHVDERLTRAQLKTVRKAVSKLLNRARAFFILRTV